MGTFIISQIKYHLEILNSQHSLSPVHNSEHYACSVF